MAKRKLNVISSFVQTHLMLETREALQTRLMSETREALQTHFVLEEASA
jgi:hypothetical protein